VLTSLKLSITIFISQNKSKFPLLLSDLRELCSFFYIFANLFSADTFYLHCIQALFSSRKRCGSNKGSRDFFSGCDLRKACQILIIFGRNVAQTSADQNDQTSLLAKEAILSTLGYSRVSRLLPLHSLDSAAVYNGAVERCRNSCARAYVLVVFSSGSRSNQEIRVIGQHDAATPSARTIVGLNPVSISSISSGRSSSCRCRWVALTESPPGSIEVPPASMEAVRSSSYYDWRADGRPSCSWSLCLRRCL